MRREYHRWWSPSLRRDMELLEYGHGGATVLVFPTSFGKFHEWEDRGLLRGIDHGLRHGWYHVFCLNTVDGVGGWYDRGAHPGARAWRQKEYESYLLNEVLPLAKRHNPHPYTITCGASFGAYHALDFGLRHPDRVNRVVSLSGVCDIRRFAHGYHDRNIFEVNPVEFVGYEHDPWRLDHLRRMDIILAVGNGDQLVHQNRELSAKLWGKGVGNALREWDGFAHDWPVWERQFPMYLGGHH